MQIFEDLVKCKDCMNNINHKCILYPGKDVNEKDTGCYVGIDKVNKQRVIKLQKCNKTYKKSLEKCERKD